MQALYLEIKTSSSAPSIWNDLTPDDIDINAPLFGDGLGLGLYRCTGTGTGSKK